MSVPRAQIAELHADDKLDRFAVRGLGDRGVRRGRLARDRARMEHRAAGLSYLRHPLAPRRWPDGHAPKAFGHASIRTTVDLYAHLATEDVAADLSRVIAARETRLRNQSDAQTRISKPKEATSGFEPLYEALQASA